MQLHYIDCIKWINICDRSSMSIDNDISEIRKYKEQCDHITAYMKEVLCTRLESILGANVYSDHDFTSNINFPKVTTLYIVNNDRFNGNIKDVITTRLPCLMSTDQLFKKKRGSLLPSMGVVEQQFFEPHIYNRHNSQLVTDEGFRQHLGQKTWLVRDHWLQLRQRIIFLMLWYIPLFLNTSFFIWSIWNHGMSAISAYFAVIFFIGSSDPQL